MKRLPIIGIYSIRNMVNNKLYIGSSTYVQKRLVEHRRCLKNNIHTNQHLQHA
jgi:predicted GIY-YIG superfamily endonuclease